jgi:hypothetical protein
MVVIPDNILAYILLPVLDMAQAEQAGELRNQIGDLIKIHMDPLVLLVQFLFGGVNKI